MRFQAPEHGESNGVGSVQAVETLVSIVVACAAFAIGLAVFRRLKPHFEDFL